MYCTWAELGNETVFVGHSTNRTFNKKHKNTVAQLYLKTQYSDLFYKQTARANHLLLYRSFADYINVRNLTIRNTSRNKTFDANAMANKPCQTFSRTKSLP